MNLSKSRNPKVWISHNITDFDGLAHKYQLLNNSGFRLFIAWVGELQALENAILRSGFRRSFA
jgi:hypothetical protein